MINPLDIQNKYILFMRGKAFVLKLLFVLTCFEILQFHLIFFCKYNILYLHLNAFLQTRVFLFAHRIVSIQS